MLLATALVNICWLRAWRIPRSASLTELALRLTGSNWRFSIETRDCGIVAKVSAKHLPAYLDEMAFRFNDRSNPYLFRDTLMKLIEAPVLEYKKLTAA